MPDRHTRIATPRLSIAEATDDSPFRSATYLATLARARRFARDDRAAILIEGEAGTGKTLLARNIHQASARARGPFNHIVLSTLDDALASSELFGHVAGAFTDARTARSGQFVSANGGTLFLDEIGKASLAVQQKLLHAVEYGEVRPVGSDRAITVDARIIAATNVPLEHLVETERFLPDLEARLGLFRIQLPPLRARRADIPVLVAQCVRAHAARCRYDRPPEIDDELLAALCAAEWPNNVRQLSSTVHRILVDAEGAPVLTLAHCVDELAYLRGVRVREPATLTLADIDHACEEAGSVAGAARLLGVDRTTIYRTRRRASDSEIRANSR